MVCRSDLDSFASVIFFVRTANNRQGRACYVPENGAGRDTDLLKFTSPNSANPALLDQAPWLPG